MQQRRLPDAELVGVGDLRLVETLAPDVPVQHQEARDAAWDAAVASNPTGLFDGPVVACADLHRAEHEVVLRWARVTYRHFALRRVPGATPLPSLFVAVAQPTDEGGLLVGRMALTTAAPRRLQLPGGSVEPPGDAEELDAAALARHAARELLEETGIAVDHGDLRLWTLSRGEHGNIGVFFRAPSLPEALVRERFQTLLDAELAAGREPELDDIVFPRSPRDMAALDGPRVDYLAPILDLHESERLQAV
jgi:8-oxo-dGTP pyrophosphatase MutT (NUDIX family)